MSCGIYRIVNLVNGKCYVGKSVDIEDRFIKHKYLLNSSKRSKDCNRYLFSSWKKYGANNFKLEILELCERDDDIMKDREIFWMDYFNSCDRDSGYNLRRDSSSQTTVHKDTIELIRQNVSGSKNPNYGNKWTDEMKKSLSIKQKKRYEDGNWNYNPMSAVNSLKTKKKNWEDAEVYNKFRHKVSDKNRKYNIAKLDYNTLEVLEIFNGRLDLKEKNPEYYIQAILGCCSGNKNSYKGFKWKYIDR